MKNQQFVAILLFILCVLSIQMTHAARVFVHPSAINNKANIDFIKKQIAKNTQPWLAEFNQLKKSVLLNQKPHVLQTLNSKNNQESADMRDDAIAAYSLALMWVITDKDYATRAITILNAWSGFKSFTRVSNQDKLQAGWTGGVFASSAELMRAYQGWSQNQISNVQLMFKKAFYSQLVIASSWNDNVDLTQIDTLISIAVFNDDDDEEGFNMALTRLAQRNLAYFYLTSDGRGTPVQGDGGNLDQFWSNPTQWVNGLNQETCRDNGHHSQYALASALHVAEVFWNQGVDVYSENKLRYTAAI